MKFKFKNQQLTLYDTINDCRTDSNKKGYGCFKKGSRIYYFDLVPTTDPFATELRYKKKSTGTTYAIADSNLKDLSRWGKYNNDKFDTNNYKTGTNLTQDGVNYLKYARGINMTDMFQNCSNLTTLDTSNWDTSNVISMEQMFENCRLLASLDLSDFDTSNVTNMSKMFYICSKLSTLNVSNWNVSSVTDMGDMFNECGALKTLDISNWNVSNVTSLSATFHGCSGLTSLDLSRWAPKQGTDFYMTFENCSNLKVLDISNFDTNNNRSMVRMFDRTGLEYLIIGSSIFKFPLTTSFTGLNTTCKILVPRALLDTFKTATNWSSRASQFDAIENYNITRSNGKVTVTHK